MPKQNIGTAQAQALADGFIDSIGSSAELNDLPLNNSVRQLVMLGAGLVNIARDNLQRQGHISSGSLSDSLAVLDPKLEIKSIAVEIEAAYYSDFINSGVKGTVIRGQGKYSFRFSNPTPKHVIAIIGWLKRSGRAITNVKVSVGKLETKNASISQFDSAYAVARSIKMKGIKPSGYFDDAVLKTELMADEELGKGFELDVFNAIPYSVGGDAPNSP